ncbi:MAG TPA: ornithine carbamoyltransferase [Acidimicrobiales bacterium]|nr:ornithine carbamoyltransferase [Acidimicrobiales bacterium]
MTTQGLLLNLKGRSLVQDSDLTREEFLALIALASRLRDEKRWHVEKARLIGRNIALIFEKASTRTRSAFEVAAHDQGAHVTYMGPSESQLGHKETVRDTARVLGRMYDGIEFRGFAHHDVVELAAAAGVPVWNGLTDQWHPTQLLADVMTIEDHARAPLDDVAVSYVGDARNNTANSLLVVGAMLGLDVRVAAPESLQPSDAVRALADDLARHSGARVLVTSDPEAAVAHTDFVYTDVWLSMGEAPERWAERIKLLLPYQVNAAMLEMTRNPEVRFMHCLPALHNAETEVGAQLAAQYGLDALEVTDEVFESHASIVFDQAENRLHTIKALMVATLTGE